MLNSDEVYEALTSVIDPEIQRPITDLNMVDEVRVDDDGNVFVRILLTIPGCPLKNTIEADTRAAVEALEGVASVEVEMGAMNDAQRAALQEKLQGGAKVRVIPFAQPDSLTRVYAITSGKGGVGKSSVTANLAVAMAKSGLKVGVVDADIYGFSIPRMLGVDEEATTWEDMIIPPVAQGIKVMSIGMFVHNNGPVIWRGPMLHRALEQFLADVYWGDLDVLLLDLPPGTGDIAISCAQLIPNSEVVIVTTPQAAAAEVAERSGQLALQTGQRVVGVIENMSYMLMPDGSHNHIFGEGGGQTVAQELSAQLGYEVPVLGQVPLEAAVREGGDSGMPIAATDVDSPARTVLEEIAETLARRARGLAGRSLNISPQ